MEKSAAFSNRPRGPRSQAASQSASFEVAGRSIAGGRLVHEGCVFDISKVVASKRPEPRLRLEELLRVLALRRVLYGARGEPILQDHEQLVSSCKVASVAGGVKGLEGVVRSPPAETEACLSSVHNLAPVRRLSQTPPRNPLRSSWILGCKSQ